MGIFVNGDLREKNFPINQTLNKDMQWSIIVEFFKVRIWFSWLIKTCSEKFNEKYKVKDNIEYVNFTDLWIINSCTGWQVSSCIGPDVLRWVDIFSQVCGIMFAKAQIVE